MSEIVLTIEGVDLRDLYGERNKNLNIIKNAYPDLQIVSRGNFLKINGNKKSSQNAKSNLETLVRLLKMNKHLDDHTVKDVVNGENIFVDNDKNGNPRTVIVHGRDGKPIKARTRNQKKMVQSIEKNDIVFAIGPAGTGKTYTAVALAVRALKHKLVRKIILTRPAVEAGESLGFLPGDLKDKVDPYLRPLYDALDDMIPAEKLNQLMENRTIEIAPLAYMRGRTLDNAFIILDEAQNCTMPQIKMFLTRLGPSAKCMITGDMSQVDLPRSQKSGLVKAVDILESIGGIDFIKLDEQDVVRHRLVKQIIKAFKKEEEQFIPKSKNKAKNTVANFEEE
ncbi:PhoH family protein [Membranihabitans maritimus]|uniref:PhoH family protein n=1 Tax=Membranihabitans maritimus TaxID=2904244 RepID=UPI001F2023DB|nr:PhoH family protein [Membranihabitans maritimus]